MHGLPLGDYFWVGERVGDVDSLRKAVKNLAPYVVPSIDFATGTKVENEDEPYLHAIPYMQFPLLMAGRLFTAERGFVPGVRCIPEYRDLRKTWELYQAHPEQCHRRGWWDSVTGHVEAQPTHLPMVEEGTCAYLEIGDSDLFAQPLPKDVVASAYANRDLYLVLANYGRVPAEVVTSGAYVSTSDPQSAPKSRWNVEGRSLCILRRS